MRFLVLICCLLLAGGCDESPTAPTAPLNARFTLAPGEAAAIESASLTVRFNRITGDSRCPGDAICIQGGSADVHITAMSSQDSQDYVLRTGDMQPVSHRGFTIALVDVQPYPFSSRPPIQPGDYRVTLTVAR